MSNQELLECIVGYLPYNVKGVFLFNGKKEGQIVNKSKTLDLRTVAFYMENSDHIYFKPILRPLSDLTKPCLEGGKVPIVELEEMFGQTLKTDESMHLIQPITCEPYILIRKLFEWHFDIHGLIPRYAIDINTLK